MLEGKTTTSQKVTAAIMEKSCNTDNMNGLDLLLGYSPFSELMHQLALACLLKERAITRLLGLSGTPQSTSIETHNRLFDVTVNMEDGSHAHIELKLDAILGEDQLARQRKKIEKLQQEMLYILLGGSQFISSGDDLVATWVGGSTQSIEVAEDGTVTRGPVIPFSSTSPKVCQLPQMIDVLSKASPELDGAVRELADAYRRCLEDIQKTFEVFERPPITKWTNAHWNSFYDYVRASLFPSASILNRFGTARLSWGYQELHCVRIAVADFFEYGVHLESEGNTVAIKLDVTGTYDADDARAVRKKFTRFVQSAADAIKLRLVLSKPHVGEKMTIATVAEGYLSSDSSDTLDWNHASNILRLTDSVVCDAVKLFRKRQGRRKFEEE